MKKIILATAMLAASSYLPAQALGYFVELDVGKPEFTIQENSTQSAQNFSSGAPRREDAKGTTLQGKFGLQLNENFGFYLLYGEGQESADFDSGERLDVDRYYGIFARAGKKMNSFLGFHGQVGYNWLKYTRETAALGKQNLDLNEVGFGLGFDFYPSENFSFILEWNHLGDRKEDDDPDDNDALRIAGLFFGIRLLIPGGDD